jgi:hypothetical protein
LEEYLGKSIIFITILTNSRGPPSNDLRYSSIINGNYKYKHINLKKKIVYYSKKKKKEN